VSSSRKRLSPFRRRAQLLLQDAVASLSPRMTIGRALEEPIAIHRTAAREDADRARRHPAAPRPLPDVLAKFPHQISGGRRAASVSRAHC
jgi:peptide/nickel transport system ATP-binding protein